LKRSFPHSARKKPLRIPAARTLYNKYIAYACVPLIVILWAWNELNFRRYYGAMRVKEELSDQT
jgi:hypothetical protein